MSLPVDSSHKAALPSLPLESTYCDREINIIQRELIYLHSIAVRDYWREEGGEWEVSYLWVFREPHWGNLHNEIQVFIHTICSCQDTPTLPAPCCVPQWNCSHSDCSLHPISEVKQAQILPCTVKHSSSSTKAFIIVFLLVPEWLHLCLQWRTVDHLMNSQPAVPQSHVTVMWCLKSVHQVKDNRECHVVVMWPPLMNYCITHYLSTGDHHVRTSWILNVSTHWCHVNTCLLM